MVNESAFEIFQDRNTCLNSPGRFLSLFNYEVTKALRPSP